MAQIGRKDVKYVVIDMNRYFKEVAEACFPNAKIVIDGMQTDLPKVAITKQRY